MGIYRLCFSRLLEKSRMSKQLQPDAAFANSADYESTTAGGAGESLKALGASNCPMVRFA